MSEISIILPAYNAEQFLDDAVESIVEQSFRDWTLYIHDDGSLDGTLEKAEKWKERDPRIVVSSSENRGIIATLNELVRRSDSPYIARMDSDDISAQQRLSLQHTAMELNEKCGILGSWVEVFGQSSDKWHFRCTHAETRALSFVGTTCLCHPSTMVRRDVLERFPYSEQYLHLEDMEQYFRVLSQSDYQMYALPEYLLKYRKHNDSICAIHRQSQLHDKTQILAQTWASVGLHQIVQFTPDLIKIRYRQYKACEIEMLLVSLIQVLDAFMFSDEKEVVSELLKLQAQLQREVMQLGIAGA